MREIKLRLDFEIPHNPLEWTVLGDAVAAKYSYLLNHEPLHGRVGIGYEWISRRSVVTIPETWKRLVRYLPETFLSAEAEWYMLESWIRTDKLDNPKLTVIGRED